MSLSLKHIPCPAGASCTAFQCIFGHGEDKPAIAESKATSGNRERPSSPTTIQEAPRKRIKTDQSDDASAFPRVDRNHGNNDQSNIRFTASRAVSPSPVYRATKAIAKFPTSSAGSSKSPIIKAARDSPQTRKPETLNPRLLKSSPASHETRLKLLKMLHAEFARLNRELRSGGKPDEPKLVLSDQNLIFKALDIEQATALEKPAVYANVMKNKVVQYKRMQVSQWKDERLAEQASSREDINGSVRPKEVNTGLNSTQEVMFLKRLVTKIDDLSGHGYVSSVPSPAAVEAARSGMEAARGWEKCDRCQQRFQVFPGRREEDGALTSGGPCNFHWGRAYVPAKALGDYSRVAKRYQCCGQEVGDSAGCVTHDQHVFKVNDAKRLAAVLNYASTPDNPKVSDDKAVCFDCEMGYTVHGMELIRLTATAWPGGNELLDVLVQPLGEILDLNSRFSGVWPDDLANATAWKPPSDAEAATLTDDNTGIISTSTSGRVEVKQKQLRKVSSPQVARDLLFSLLSPSTPLIGHGLENDLNAVRVVHPTLIDTVLLYPHKGGLPFRNSLKMLMSVHLQKKIQRETGTTALGHDSAEDARAAGELVRFKVMNEWKDMQRVGWRLADGEFLPPGNPEGKLTETFIEA